jgi:hypothetical protein
MSLEYYLFTKKRIDNNIKYLEEMINEYHLIFTEANNCDISITEKLLDEIKFVENNDDFIHKLKCMRQLKDSIVKKINELCEHNYVEDIIDISPEYSKKITYCEICEHTI